MPFLWRWSPLVGRRRRLPFISARRAENAMAIMNKWRPQDAPYMRAPARSGGARSHPRKNAARIQRVAAGFIVPDWQVRRNRSVQDHGNSAAQHARAAAMPQYRTLKVIP